MKTLIGSKFLIRILEAFVLFACGQVVTACGSSTSGGHEHQPDAGNAIFGAGGTNSLGQSGNGGVPPGAGGTSVTGGTGSGSVVDAGVDAHDDSGVVAKGSDAGSTEGGTGGGAEGCVVPATLLDVSNDVACSSTDFPLCTNGKCVASSLVPEASAAFFADCGTGSKCIPAYVLARAGKFIPPTCTSVNGEEGRCLSTCIPSIASQAASLPRDVCGAGDLCAPCYDPRTGANTHACDQGCDPGPTEAPNPFQACCGGLGSCVPSSSLSSAILLDKDVCKNAADLCSPNDLSDGTSQPPICTSLGGSEGRCLESCLPDIASEASSLPQDVCASGYLCAPCYDPISGEETSACTQNGDTPKNQPFQFPGCCSGLGHCLPSTLLTAGEQASLDKDTCTGSGSLCSPDVFSVTGDLPKACTALGAVGAEGRCIPACVPSIQAEKARLDSGSPACPANTLCAPCYDPQTGSDTGVCDENGDAPKAAKKTFTACCGGVGDCVPKTYVAASTAAELGADTCTGTSLVCAPTALLDPSAKPASCTAPGNLEARCLPSCMPKVAAAASTLLEETCAANELCVPCYDPVTGVDSGACKFNGDKPAGAKTLYPTCCPYPATNGAARGTCVPTVLIGSTEASTLPQDSCGAGSLCMPDLKVADATANFPSCSAGLGACLPDCQITNPIVKATLNGIGCNAGELCTPCGTAGACE